MRQDSSLNPCRAAADAGRGWWRTTTGVAAPRRCGVSAGHELFSRTALAQQVAARGLPVQVHHAPTFDEVERRAGFAFFPALVWRSKHYAATSSRLALLQRRQRPDMVRRCATCFALPRTMPTRSGTQRSSRNTLFSVCLLRPTAARGERSVILGLTRQKQ